jgi:hypothetical protein
MPSLEFSKGKDSDDNNVGSHVFCVPRASLMFRPAQSPPLSDDASAGIMHRRQLRLMRRQMYVLLPAK